jgi:hypothetical protein
MNVKSKYKTLRIDKLVTGDGRPLPLRLASEITREIARLALIQEQIATLERERDQANALQGHREEESSVDEFDRDRTGHCRRHDTRGLLSPIRQPAAGGRLSRSCNESSRQRRRGAIPGNLASRARAKCAGP